MDKVRTIRDAGYLHSMTEFENASLAIEAIRCWVQEAEAMGWKREQLAATLEISDNGARSLLGTRSFVAGLVDGFSGAERERRRGIREDFAEDAYVLVGLSGRPRTAGRALADVDTIVAQLAWSSGGQL
ncbi:MAG TPA: hypothetical protein VHP33_10380 [Polyangiaceae bacterium]|nr:hypothetical protein [Polyangiaceae bacterium]